MKQLCFSVIVFFFVLVNLNAQIDIKNEGELKVSTSETVPAVPILRIVKVTPVNELTQNVEIEFFSEGATQYAILHEEIGEPFIFTQSILATTGYIRFVITDVYKQSQHIFTVNASNEYGVMSTSINYDPTKDLPTSLQLNAGIANIRLLLQFKDHQQQLIYPPLKQVKLVDLTGRLELYQPIYTNNPQSIDLTKIKQGIHIIQVMDMNDKTYTAKIIIP